MKKLMIIIPITVVIAVMFGTILASSIGTLESVYAQTNATNANNNTATGIGSASEIENLTGGNTGLLQNSSDIASPSTGLTQGLEKEQTTDTEGNMTAADKTAGGQNATTAGGSSGGANATTTANNTNANQTSSENKTGNPLRNVPIIGELFK